MASSLIYVIHSHKSIKEIACLFEECGEVKYIGIIYKTHRNHGKTEKKETQMTIIICPETTMALFKQKYPEMLDHVSDYNWETFPMPKEETGETWDLHISGIPDDFTEAEAKNFVIGSLDCILKEVEVVNGAMKRNYTVDFPLRSRGTGFIKGFGKIVFAAHVDQMVIKMCKVILHNTPLSKKNGTEAIMVSCVWHRLNMKAVLDGITKTQTQPKKKYNLTEAPIFRLSSGPKFVPEKESQVSVTNLTESGNIVKETN